MAKKTMEVHVESVQLVSTGKASKKETQHALSATLIWPRPAIARKEAALSCELVKGGVDFATAPWHETILFKEQVEGKFGVQVEVSEALSNAVLEAFIRSFSTVMLKDVSALIGKADLAFGDLLSSLFSSAGKSSGSSGPKPVMVAEGAVTLDPANLTEGMLVEVPLVAPRAISETSASADVGRGVARKRKVAVAKGASNGVAKIRIHLV